MNLKLIPYSLIFVSQGIEFSSDSKYILARFQIAGKNYIVFIGQDGNRFLEPVSLGTGWIATKKHFQNICWGVEKITVDGQKVFDSEFIEIKLNDEYTAKVGADIVVVGCQEIPSDKVLEIADKIKKLRAS